MAEDRDATQKGSGFNWRLLGLVLFALVAIFLVVAFFFDEPVSRALAAWPPGEQAFFHWITEFGEGAVVLVPALVLWIVGWLGWRLLRRYWWRWTARAISILSLFTFGAVGLPGLISAILKRLFGRARPLHLDSEGVFSFAFFKPFAWDFQSFPSGHATTSLAFALTMTLLFGRKGAWVFIPALLIALSRIVIQMHFLSDVAFGAALGLLVAWTMADQWRAKGWIYAPAPGWRNRFSPLLGRQWRRLIRRLPKDSAQSRP